MGFPKQIDLTKPSLDWKYLLVLIAIVVVLLGAWAVGSWVFGKVSSLTSSVTTPAEEPTI